MKAIERITIEKLPESSRRYPRFRFRARRPSGRRVLELTGIHKAYEDNQVLDEVSLTVQRGERLAIIGPNGIGKSTLLQIAMGEIEADAGRVDWGYETYRGYIAQDHKTQIGSHQQTLESWLWDYCPGEGIGFVKGQLAAVLFSGDEAKKKLSALSGGEAARLMFARQATEKPNALLLDEPTNHLDLEAIEALVEALLAYDGTLVFVSHDRWFVNQLATRILAITPEGIEDFSGSYDEYLARAGEDHLDADQVVQKARAARQGARAENGGGR
jgi:ATPase subunit of ABC transporter with duplicated ATPase domains